jgi:hypothetical protein
MLWGGMNMDLFFPEYFNDIETIAKIYTVLWRLREYTSAPRLPIFDEQKTDYRRLHTDWMGKQTIVVPLYPLTD